MASSRTPREARNAIQLSFKAHWDGLASPAPVVYDNKPFDRQGSEYVHLNIAHNAGTVAALGNKKYRRIGTVILNMFVPEAVGQARMDEIAEDALAWVETLNITGLRLRDPSYNEIGSFGGYWQANMSVLFEYDTVRT